MEQARRKFLVTSVAGGTALLALGAMRPISAAGLQWNPSATGANSLADAYQGLGVGKMIESRDILIKAPTIAESGAVVPVEVSSTLSGTSSIAILVEKNSNPLAASFAIPPGTEGFVSTRVKMSGSSPVHVVVQSGNQFYHAVKDVKVTIGGCGGAAPQTKQEKDHV